MEPLPKSLPYTVIPNGGRLAFRLLDIVTDDVYVIVPSLAVIVAASQVYGLRFGVVAAIVFCLLMFRYPYGRGYSVLADYARSLYIMHVLRGVLQDPASTSRVAYRLRQRQLSRLSVQRIDAGARSVGVLHDERRKLDHLYIEGSGSDASAHDPDGYLEFNTRIAQIVKHAKSETPLQIGTSYGRLLRPFDEWRYASSLFQIMDPDVAVPEGLVLADHASLTRRQRVDFRLHQNANQLKTLMTEKGAEPVYGFVVTVKRPSAWRKLKKRNLSDRDLYSAPLMRMASTITEDLEQAGVENVRWLSLTEMAHRYRLFWDVYQLDSYRKDCANGTVPMRDDQLEVSETGEVITPLRHQPTGEIIVGHNWIKVGDTYHRTLRVTSFPRQALPSIIHSLYNVTSHWSGVTFAGETISGTAESRRFTWGITLLRGVERARGSKVYQTHDEKLKRRDLEQRHVEIQRSGSVGQPGNVFITVSGATLDDLDDAQHAFEKHARAKNLTVRAVNGASRQFPALQAGNLGISML